MTHEEWTSVATTRLMALEAMMLLALAKDERAAAVESAHEIVRDIHNTLLRKGMPETTLQTEIVEASIAGSRQNYELLCQMLAEKGL